MRAVRRRIRRCRDIRRDEYPNLSRLAWQAKRRSGTETLEVLQDALMTHFPAEFRAARKQAAARKEHRGGVDQYVIFLPSLERERRKPERARRIRHMTPEVARWYRENLPGEPTNPKEYSAWMSKRRWPFSITNKPLAVGGGAVIVWGTDVKFKTHPLNLKNKQVLTEEELKRLIRINNTREGATQMYEADSVLLKKGFIRKDSFRYLFITRKGRMYLRPILFAK